MDKKEASKTVAHLLREFMESSRRQMFLLLIGLVLLVLVCTLLRLPDRVNSIEDVPPFGRDAYVVIERNVPSFQTSDISTTCFVDYPPLDVLGRPGAVTACIGPESLPKHLREITNTVQPAGWQETAHKENHGGKLYSRCELVGNRLTGDDEYAENLFTATGYLKNGALAEMENVVSRYVNSSKNHVLYRVTPIYQDNELLARGLELEAFSIEDNGVGICIHVYLYNNQPGVEIDYATGHSTLVSAQ